MDFGDVEHAIDETLERCLVLVEHRRGPEILNERFFHHMFSSFLRSRLLTSGEDIWESLSLVPEAPTQEIFLRREIRTADSSYTREHAIGKGKAGNVDFLLRTNPPAWVEWKGPGLFSSDDVAWVMLKLRSVSSPATRVFVAIVVGGKRGRNHREELAKQRLAIGDAFARDVLPNQNPLGFDLRVYLASVTEGGLNKVYWGPYVTHFD
jgi:hypothetical protein